MGLGDLHRDLAHRNSCGLDYLLISPHSAEGQERKNLAKQETADCWHPVLGNVDLREGSIDIFLVLANLLLKDEPVNSINIHAVLQRGDDQRTYFEKKPPKGTEYEQRAARPVLLDGFLLLHSLRQPSLHCHTRP